MGDEHSILSVTVWFYKSIDSVGYYHGVDMWGDVALEALSNTEGRRRG